MAAPVGQRFSKIADSETVRYNMIAHGGIERIPQFLIDKAYSARAANRGFFKVCPELIRAYLRYEQNEIDEGNILESSPMEAVVDLVCRFSAQFTHQPSVIRIRVSAIYKTCLDELNSTG